MPVLVVASPKSGPPPGTDKAPAATGREGARAAVSRRRLSARDLETFTRNLETQLDAGVPLVRALQVQVEHAESPATAEVASGLLQHLHGGLGLSDALDLFPHAFSAIYRSLVRAGEHSGRLPLVLRELAQFIAWREDVRKTVRKAATYPVLVLVASAGLVLLVVGYVLPKFGDLFARLGDQTPVAARVLLATGSFVAGHSWELAAVLASLLALAIGLRRNGYVRRQAYRTAARLPVFGRVLAALDLARLTRTLAIITGAGVPIMRGLELGRDAVSDPRSLTKLADLSRAVEGGQTLGQAAAACDLFPPLALNLLAVGEESGQMPAMLDRLAATFDRSVRDAVQRALSLLEPAFTLFLGVVVGGLALVVITTLYKTMLVLGK